MSETLREGRRSVVVWGGEGECLVFLGSGDEVGDGRGGFMVVQATKRNP